MKDFTLGGVVNYARYHFTTQYKLYLTLLLQLLLFPLFFAAVGRDADAVYIISVAIYIFATFRLCYSMVWPMRDRGTKIIEMTVPASSKERICFMLFNSLVLYPLIAFVMAVLAISLGALFYYGELDLLGRIREMIHEIYFFWGFYIFIQILISGSLIINLLARRSLIMAYVVAFGILLLFFILVVRVGLETIVHFEDQLANIEFVYVPQWLGITIYSLIPISMYGVCYKLLCKRQIKW
jgi:hypothetical protein